MKRHYIFRTLLAALLAFGPLSLFAAGNLEDMFDSYNLRDSLAMKGKTIFFDNPDYEALDKTSLNVSGKGSIYLEYLRNRRALTGESCAINKMINSVGVGSWNDNLGNLLDDDLTNYCEFNAVASVGVTVNPYVSIRDRSCYYAKGSEAGFCIVASSGSVVLALDIVKAMAIGFYRDGQLVGTVPVTAGQNASGVNLSLINVPGSDAAMIYLTAEAPGVFDEISLDPAGGVNVSAGDVVRIKYAFVGRQRRFTITENLGNGAIKVDDSSQMYGKPDNAYQKYLAARGENNEVDLKSYMVYNPVLLGLPFPAVDRAKFVDNDLENYATITPLIAAGYQGGAKFQMTNTSIDPRYVGQEVFAAGTEVGFKYRIAKALELGVGTWMQIVLFDLNGNKIYTEDIKASVLGLSVAGGGAGATSITAPVAFSGAEIRFMTVLDVDLGGMGMYYAFINEQPDIRHHCPINPSANTALCQDQTSFQLRSNPAVSVTWSLDPRSDGAHVSVTPDGYVTGMDDDIDDPNGDFNYVFVATAADGCVDYVTISKGHQAIGGAVDDCGEALIKKNPEDNRFIALDEKYFDGLTGGLAHVNNLQNKDNILDDNFEDYATYAGELELLTNFPIIGIKSVTDEPIFSSKADGTGKGVRLGFMVESDVEGLNLAALQFYQIRVYDKDNNQIYTRVIDESNAVATDIGGSNSSQKMRYSIPVPGLIDGQDYEVYSFALWSSGVLDVKIGSLKIYYGFVDNVDSPCNDPLGCNAVPLSASHTHTTLDFDLMQGGSAIVVANAVNDLDNLVDDDMDSYMSLANTVSAGDGVPIAVRLGRTLDYRTQLGFVMDNKTFLAGINAGSWMTVETYYRGEPTGETFTDWNLVDANVIGYGDKNIIIVQPKLLYDEVKLTVAKVVGALDIMKFYGLFTRSDIDNDGIPDCQDLKSCENSIPENEIQITKVCENQPIKLTARAKENSKYFIYFSEPEINGEGKQTPRVIEASTPLGLQLLMAEYQTERAGNYQVIIYDEEGNPLAAKAYTVHPLETTWLKTATNSDWNKWDNWSNGAPYCCTNVIIPSDAVTYPVLDNELTGGDEYCCDSIHFAARSEVGAVNRLNYSRAWVDMELKPNRYNLLSAPLQAMVTGDMFIPAAMQGVHSGNLFSDLDSLSTPENRFDPTVYQRLWNNVAYDRLWNRPDLAEVGTELDNVMQTTWSHSFNYLNHAYAPGEGFSLWVDNGNLPETQEFRFRFPKLHKTYNYFNDYDRQPIAGKFETGIDRTGAGRFGFEPLVAATDTILFKNGGYTRSVYCGDFEVKLTAPAPTDHFLFGNPLMSNIAIGEFLKANPEVKSVSTFDGTALQTIADDASTDAVAAIKPMQAVFLSLNSAVSELTVNITAQMLASSALNKANEAPALRISAISGKSIASMAVAETDCENRMLFDNEVAPTLAVFTVKDGEALNIAQCGDQVPLTIINTDAAPLTISFFAVGGFDRDAYRLLDRQTGASYSLDDAIELPKGVGTTSGRFVLARIIQSSIENVEASAPSVYVQARGTELTIISSDSAIAEAAVYDLAGHRLCASAVPGARELTLRLTPGLRLITVRTTDGRTHTFKLLLHVQ